MSVVKQVIKLKRQDLNQAIVRGLSKSAREAKKIFPLKEKVQGNIKRSQPRYKKDFFNLDE